MFKFPLNCLKGQREKNQLYYSILFDFTERLTFRDVQSPQEFRHGETAEVVCDVISSPVPVVVWYYQDREITEEHHSKSRAPIVNIEQITNLPTCVHEGCDSFSVRLLNQRGSNLIAYCCRGVKLN